VCSYCRPSVAFLVYVFSCLWLLPKKPPPTCRVLRDLQLVDRRRQTALASVPENSADLRACRPTPSSMGCLISPPCNAGLGPPHRRAGAPPASQFLLQSTRRRLSSSQGASRVVPCQCQRRHRLLTGAPMPCNDVRVHASGDGAGPAGSARPQGDVLTPQSRVAGAASGFGICEAESSAGGATPVPRIRTPWRK
jgi:hypothetical protein